MGRPLRRQKACMAAIFDVNWARNPFENTQPRTPSESGTKWLTGRLNASGSSDRGEAQA